MKEVLKKGSASDDIGNTAPKKKVHLVILVALNRKVIVLLVIQGKLHQRIKLLIIIK